MRRLNRFFRIGVVFFAVSATAASAQGLNSIRGPAEEPPPGYQGRQYVDSAGCIFVRAGVGGNITWVPRVDRDRRQICGQTPTPGRAATAVAQTPRTAPAPSPTAVPRPAAAPVTVAPPVAARPAPPPALAAAPAPAVPAGVVVLTASAGAPSASDAAVLGNVCEQRRPGGNYRVTIGSRQFTVRCGPQTQRTADKTQSVAPRRASVPESTRDAGFGIAVPEGYQPAHEPGRLNPYRAQGTPEGEAAMNRLWTQTVPRREIPGAAKATRAQGYVFASSRGLLASSAPEMHRVQVATFANPENAEQTRARFRTLGLPVETRLLGRGGFLYEVVYLGPFLRRDELEGALEAARRAGFGDARAVR